MAVSQDLVDTLCSNEGTSLRNKIVAILSRFVSLSTLPRIIATCVAMVAKGIISSIAQRLQGVRSGAQKFPKLIRLPNGVQVMGVQLSRVAVKRLHLGALIALDRLWKESKWKTVISIFLFAKLGVAALFHPKPSTVS